MSKSPLMRVAGRSAIIVGALFAIELALMALLPLTGLQGTSAAIADALCLALLAIPVFRAADLTTWTSPPSGSPVNVARIHLPQERYTVVVLLALVGLVLIIALLYADASRGTQTAGRVINMAGRERMLSQYITRQALARRFLPAGDSSQSNEHDKRLTQACTTFERTLDGLLDGNTDMSFPPCESQTARLYLERARDRWSVLRRLLGSDGGIETAEGAAALKRASDRLLASLDEAVASLEQHYDSRAHRIRTFIRLVLGAATIISILTVISFLHMIRARRRAVAALIRSEARYRHVIQTAGDAIITVDEQGRVNEFNDTAVAMFGYSRDEILGQEMTLLVAENQRERHSRGLAGFLRTGRRRLPSWTVIEVTGKHRDGREIDLEMSLSVLESQGAINVTAVLRDVTQRKQAQDELTRMNASLERAIARATELARTAEIANQAKSEFLANMSHEIRTPMNAVIGMTTLLTDTTLTPEQRECIDTIRLSGDQLLATINDILGFSKLESSQVVLLKKPFDLTEVVDEALEIASPQVQPGGPEIAADVDPRCPRRLVGDAARLRQVLVNLIGNAVKFTEKGEILVSVSSPAIHGREPRHEEGGLCEVHFTVRDTGIGIPEESTTHIFDPFCQVDSSSTRRHEGTGLGLAICKKLVEIMGGRIWADGRLGCGATFHFNILAPVAQDQALAGCDALPLSRRRILIVDDHLPSAQSLARKLLVLGARPKVFTCGQKAIRWVRRGKGVNAAILDYTIPSPSGPELAREIRSTVGDREFPVLLALSPGDAHQTVESKQPDIAGLSGILHKPIGLSRLRTRLLDLFTPYSEKGQMVPLPPVIEATSAQAPRPCVLVAEDNPINQKVAVRLLKTLGYDADVAENGRKAIEALRLKCYDIVLMDVQMPEMNGLDATGAIRREWPDLERPPIVALTARALEGDREECLAAGMDDYLTKPLSRSALAKVLARWSGTRPQVGGQVDPRLNDYSRTTPG